jgi:hypothetical protein
MAYVARLTDFHRLTAPVLRTSKADAARRPSFLARLFDAIFESRERQADREAEAYLARTGHRFTDSIERELNERLFNGGWNARR